VRPGSNQGVPEANRTLGRGQLRVEVVVHLADSTAPSTRARLLDARPLIVARSPPIANPNPTPAKRAHAASRLA